MKKLLSMLMLIFAFGLVGCEAGEDGQGLDGQSSGTVVDTLERDIDTTVVDSAVVQDTVDVNVDEQEILEEE